MKSQSSTARSVSPVHDHGPSVHLHIERLVLDGLPLSHQEGALVQAAIESELTRLLGEGNLGAMSGGAIPHLPVASIQLMQDNKPSHLGNEIAQALYHGLKPATTSHHSVHSSREGAK